ncbi:MAG: hypothetical protein RIS35_1126 [Pseudomonadota bacterium]
MLILLPLAIQGREPPGANEPNVGGPPGVLRAEQIDGTLPRGTLVAPAKSGPARVDRIPQVPGAPPRATLIAPPRSAGVRLDPIYQLRQPQLTSVLGGSTRSAPPRLEASSQARLPARVALLAPNVIIGRGVDGVEYAPPATKCAAPDAGTAECRPSRDGSRDSRSPMTIDADPIDEEIWIALGAHDRDEVAPGVGIGAVAGFPSASMPVPPVRHLVAPPNRESVSSNAGGTAGASIDIRTNSLIPVAIDTAGSNGSVTVDLITAGTSSRINGLTLTGSAPVTLIATHGATLQLDGITLSASTGPGLSLSTTSGGLIRLTGGSSDGRYGTSVASVRDIAVSQSGAAHAAAIGLNGTSDATIKVRQDGAARNALQLDVQMNEVVIVITQSGNAGQSATGISLKSAPKSTFSLQQR